MENTKKGIDGNQSTNTSKSTQYLYLDPRGNATYSGDLTVTHGSYIGSKSNYIQTSGNTINGGFINTIEEMEVTLEELKISLNSLKGSISLIEMQIFQLENKGKMHKKRILKTQ